MLKRIIKVGEWIVRTAAVASALAFWVFLTKFGLSLIDEFPPLNIAAAGQLGDLVGGLTNPLISLLALMWLIRSVHIQRTELAATQKALADSATEQKKLVEIGRTSANIAALGALIQSHRAEISLLQARLEAFMRQDTFRSHRAGYDHEGRHLSESRGTSQAYIDSLNAKLAHHEELHSMYEDELRLMLDITVPSKG